MGDGGKRQQPVRVASTGGDAELVKTVRIARVGGKGRKVAMRLGQGRRPFASLPDLAPGDRLEVFAEVEVTTDSSSGQARVGKRYGYDPVVDAQLLLSGDPAATNEGANALALSTVRSETCTQAQHHRVLVFDDAGLDIPAAGLPWPGPSYVNLVLGARHPNAAQGQVLLVGENEPDGSVLGDKGRIGVVRLRPSSQPTPAPHASGPAAVSAVPVRKGKRTVVNSHRLDDLAQGEQLVVTARLLTSAVKLGYPARISTRLFLADDPAQEQPGGHAADVAASRGVITARNGFNCLPDHPHCTSRKVGVASLQRAPGRPLYVNLVADTGDPTHRGQSGDTLEVLPGGVIEVLRYPGA
jgi:hypothetical protein